MQYAPNQIPAEYGSDFIKDPTRVRRQLDRLTRDRNIADFAFGASPANNGGVVYDRVTSATVQDRLQRTAEERAEAAEFTKIGVTEGAPINAAVKEYGAETDITLRAIKRNDVREIRRRVNYLAAAVIRKIDRIAVATIANDTDINEYGITTSWGSSAADPIGDLIMARGEAEDNEADELRYNMDTVLINPSDLRQYLWANKDIREQLAKASETPSPIVDAQFEGYLGMSWVPTNEVAAGSLYMLERGTAGALGDEDGGIQTDDYVDKSRRVHTWQAFRAVVPYITDPGAIVKVEGFSGN